MANDTHIIVRDRRARHQYSVHNRLMDEWAPIIGKAGYILYSLYVRMANKEDERSFPGYSLIQAHFSMGRSTISDYNRLMEWCGLLHIEPGSHNRPNNYYILEVPEVTPERLEYIRSQALAHYKAGHRFLKTVLKRLDEWQPIQTHWENCRTGQVMVHRPSDDLQMALPLDDGGPPAEHPSPLAEHPAAPLKHSGPLDGSSSPLVESSVQQPNSAAEHVARCANQPNPDAQRGNPPAEHPSPPAEHPGPPAEHPNLPAEHPGPPTELEQSKETIQRNNPKEQSKTTTVLGGEDGFERSGHTIAAVSDEQALQALLSIDFQPASMAQRYVKKYPNEMILAWVETTGWPESDWMDNPAGYVRKRLDAGDLPPSRPDPPGGEPDQVESEMREHSPEPVLIDCPGCGELAELCSSCGQCPTCCVCATVVDGTGLTVRDAWQAALGELKLQMTRGTFNTWLKPTRVVAYGPGMFIIGADNVYMQDWLENRLHTTIVRTLTGVVGAEVEVQFVVQET